MSEFKPGDWVQRVTPLLQGDKRHGVERFGIYQVDEVVGSYGELTLKDHGGLWVARNFRLSPYHIRVPKYQPKPKPKPNPRVLTDVSVYCASGEGDELVIGFDPKGNSEGTGPCVDFTVNDSRGCKYSLQAFVDIEDLKVLDDIIASLHAMRDAWAIHA